MEMFKPLNGSKLHHLKGFRICVQSVEALGVIKTVRVPIINRGRASAWVLEKQSDSVYQGSTFSFFLWSFSLKTYIALTASAGLQWRVNLAGISKPVFHMSIIFKNALFDAVERSVRLIVWN